MKPKLYIAAILLVPWIHNAVSAQGILIRQGSYLKVPAGNMIHEPENIITQDECGLYAHGVIRLHGNMKNENSLPACIDTGKVVLEGTTREQISGAILFDNLVINNNNGVLLNSNITVNKKLSLLNGKICLGNSNLLIGPLATINGTLNANNMIVATGSGKLRKQFSSAGSFTFPVGDTNGVAQYSPVTINFSSGNFGTNNWAGVSVVNAKYPDPNIQNDYLNRYWDLATNNISSYSANVQFNYLPADVVGTESKLYSLRASPQPNTAFLPADNINHILNITGIDYFGSFTGAGPPCYNLQVNTAVVSNVSCYGAANGSAIANVSGTSGAISYLWSTTPPQTTQTAVNLPAGTYTVTVTDGFNCITQSAVTISQPVQWWPSLNGPQVVCANTGGNVYTTDPGMAAYQWSISPGGLITSGAGTNSIVVTWITTGPQTVSVNYTNSFGCTAFSPQVLNVSINPRPVPSISGPASTCQATSGLTYTTQSGMSGYAWTVSPGGIIAAGQGSNTVTVDWNNAGGQNISVNYLNSSGCTALTPAIFPVTVFPLPVPAISGPSSCCVYSMVNNYSTISGMTNYSWTVSAGGAITAGSGTNTIVVTWNSTGAQTVSVNYTDANGCTAAAATVFPVIVNSSPIPTIMGAASVCANAGLTNYYTQTGMNNYTWSVSPGGTIIWGQGSPTIQVSWTGTGAQWVNVNYLNANGCFAASPGLLNVTVNPAPDPAGPVSGPSDVCAGSQGVAFSVAAISNALTYFWTLPPGASLASGAGTNSITVNFTANASSGNLFVYGNNLCGNGGTSPPHPVTVSHMPAVAGNITGKVLVCQGQSGLVYSVAAITGATGYDWIIPPGVVIASGANTRSLTVNFTQTAQTGYFTVSGVNVCGNGPASPPLHVTVANSLPKPVIGNLTDGPALTGDTLFSSAISGNQWYLDYAILPSDTNRFIIAKTQGEYFCIVTMGFCSSDTSNHIITGPTGINENELYRFVVYPVPSEGHFTISFYCPQEDLFDISVYNNLGIEVFMINELRVFRKAEKQIDLGFLPNGIYTIAIKFRNRAVFRNIAIIK